MSKELEVIRKAVQEMADFIKECDSKNAVPVIVRSRNCGKTAAYRLARQTDDITHIEVKPKLIENDIRIQILQDKQG